jgi:hypothetical protein
MGMFQNDRAPELFVPDLTKPAGATVDADGNVTCVTCHAKLPQAKADVVGLGYRCPACTAKAELAQLTGGPSDIDANLTSSDRGALRAFGWKAIGLGVALLGGGVAVYAFAGPVRFGSYLIVAGIGSIIVGGLRIANAK